MKGLIVGGDTDVIIDILRELQSKTDKPTRNRRASQETRQSSAQSSRSRGNNAGGAGSEVPPHTCRNFRYET